MSQRAAPRLWTRDFTIITVGSVISLLGNMLSGFAVSLMVLDRTESTFLYVLFNVCWQIPMLVCPLLAGPYLDRMSRKKVIYSLDFLSSAIYLGFFLVLRTGWFHYPTMMVACLFIGAINSVYTVAYDSFYPNLISEGNYAKAYSVSSVMMDLAALAYPLGAILYEKVGVAPLFAVTSGSFFVAACFESSVRCQETHMAQAPPAAGPGTLRRFRRDLREGLDYIAGEKGLLVITLYFTVSAFAGGGADQLHLPFFRSHAGAFLAWGLAAETLYALLSNFAVVGRAVGGLLHYRTRLPVEKKFAVALTVYTVLNVLEGVCLWLPVPLMAVSFFVSGLLGVTSFNIRISATQSYLPDRVRGRFNGTFQMLCSVGGIAGSLTAGALAEIMPERRAVLLLSGVGLLGVYFLMYRGRRHVAAIYNRKV